MYDFGVNIEVLNRFKTKNQTDKIDWILNSLFKMVKLEQNIMNWANMFRKMKKLQRL